MFGKFGVFFGINIGKGRRQNGDCLSFAGKTCNLGGGIAAYGKSADDILLAFCQFYNSGIFAMQNFFSGHKRTYNRKIIISVIE